MSNEKKRGATCADTSTANPNPANSDRQTKIGELVFECIDAIAAAPYEIYPGLDFRSHDEVMGTLSCSLHLYRGPVEKDSFLKWATSFVRREAQRYQILDAAKGKYKNLIRAAISRTLFGPTKDCAVDVDDVFNDLLRLVFQMGPKLAEPGTALLSTRLYELAETHTYYYFTKPRNKRFAKVRNRVAEKGTFPLPECLSDAEFAAMRAAEENT